MEGYGPARIMVFMEIQMDEWWLRTVEVLYGVVLHEERMRLQFRRLAEGFNLAGYIEVAGGDAYRAKLDTGDRVWCVPMRRDRRIP